MHFILMSRVRIYPRREFANVKKLYNQYISELFNNKQVVKNEPYDVI